MDDNTIRYPNTEAERFTQQATFAALLRELFQFDSADLDFGIYRIMNHKRDSILRFIETELPTKISRAVGTGAIAGQDAIAAGLKKAAKDVHEYLASDALAPNGELDPRYHESVLGQRYLKWQKRAGRASTAVAIERDVFNHLFTFFRRYYQDGDFVSKRRYSRTLPYVVPYSGEDIHFHWANRDQYYVKSAEQFRDYAYRTPSGVSVRFQVRSVRVNQNDVKGDKRFFFPILDDADWDPDGRTLKIPFEYRPLTPSEATALGRKRNPQAIILTDGESRLADCHSNHATVLAEYPEALKALLDAYPTDAEEITTLFAHHASRYARKHTSDYFVHKDLGAFLRLELDHYLKSEVLNLEALGAGDEDGADAWLQLMRVIKSAAGDVIAFLEQIEGFQRMLWEKRKFAFGVAYCVAARMIPEELWSAVLECDDQWMEWRDLGLLGNDGTLFANGGHSAEERREFLVQNPSVLVDTKHFDEPFVDELLASLEGLDEVTDGLAIWSENWQALGLLKRRYSGLIDCTYLDPPYNTGTDNRFAYKDAYQHSSWLSMMSDRLALARVVSSPVSGILVSTDDGEYAHVKLCMEETWGANNFVADVIWNSRKSVSSDTLMSTAANHTTFFAKNRRELEARKAHFRLSNSDEGFSNPDDDPNGPWTLDPMDAPNVRENLTYIIANPANGQEHLPPAGRCWRFEQPETERLLKEGRVIFGRTGTAKPMYKRYLSEARERGRTPTTLWNLGDDVKSTADVIEALLRLFGTSISRETIEQLKPATLWDLWDDVKTTTDATKVLLRLFGTSIPRETINQLKPKPTELVERCAQLLTGPNGYCADYFAGSGTSGHAVINLNRKDNSRRKFIVVEMGEHFDTVLMPRLKKVAFAADWEHGKPKRPSTPEEARRGPRLIKYFCLESYEDTLNNIEFEMPERDVFDIEDYLLRYMLEWETKRCGTLLNVAHLSRPFDYALRLYHNGEVRVRQVDIPETFNYLLGLAVSRRRVLDDAGRRYLVYEGRTRDKRSGVVIWRTTEGWGTEDRVRDKEFVARQGLADGVDVVWMNGPSLVSGAELLEGLFKSRMFEAVGK